LAENDKPVLIYATFPDAAAAESVGGALVDLGLAACVNVIPQMTSIYRWKGQRQRDSEAVLIIKTRAGLAERAIAEGVKRHSYENPAFVVLPVAGGAAGYMAWLLAETAAPTDKL
jgi:periplasmic divalent cation tolerance protein